jgi:hypothetical protein
MLLNIISSIIAFVLGAISVAPLSHSTIPVEIQSYFFTSENLLFIIHSVIGGVIALWVKVIGDLLIHKWKNRKKKGGQDE